MAPLALAPLERGPEKKREQGKLAILDQREYYRILRDAGQLSNLYPKTSIIE